jgi:hypothetical protein
VQNDPVNFVDPTGLDPDDPNDPPPTTHTDPATGLPTSVPGVNAGVVTIEIGGGLGIGTGSGLGIIDQFEVDTGTRAVIGGEGSQEPSDALPFDNCSQFVKWLSEVAKYPQRLTARIFGSDLAELAYSGYERHIHNGAEGFKPELTEAGGDPTKNGEGKQGPGVYGHILFAGGVTLIQKAGDPGGWVLYHGNRLKDWGQAVRGSPQYQSERAGNIAGRAVGGQIWDYLKGGLSQADLINRLTGTLCQ